MQKEWKEVYSRGNTKFKEEHNISLHKEQILYPYRIMVIHITSYRGQPLYDSKI